MRRARSPASAQMPLEGESFAASIADASAPSKSSPQYFEMFGHRGLWHRGWKAVSFHPSGTPFENDKWELFHLDRDFSEDRRSRREGAAAARGDDQAVVARGREAQRAAARRPLRAALCRERRALPRRAPSIHLSCRHGPCADRRRARRAQPQLHHRGACRDRGMAPRAC